MVAPQSAYYLLSAVCLRNTVDTRWNSEMFSNHSPLDQTILVGLHCYWQTHSTGRRPCLIGGNWLVLRARKCVPTVQGRTETPSHSRIRRFCQAFMRLHWSLWFYVVGRYYADSDWRLPPFMLRAAPRASHLSLRLLYELLSLLENNKEEGLCYNCENEPDELDFRLPGRIRPMYKQQRLGPSLWPHPNCTRPFTNDSP